MNEIIIEVTAMAFVIYLGYRFAKWGDDKVKQDKKQKGGLNK